MNLPAYIEIIAKRYETGISSEHSYRGDLEGLIRELVPGVEITNEPSQVTACGNPDYILTKKKIPVGFIEAKDLGKDLNSQQYKEQFSRYKKALDNLIITDYLWFQFYQNGQLVHEIRIGEINGDTVKPLADHFNEFQDLIVDFGTFIGQTIKSPKKLAEMMAAKPRLLETILEHAISSDEETQDNSSLKQQYESFKEVLIHDLNPKAFADIYAQTLAYGMFAARLHDASLENFSRQEAAELIPKTNPFLRKLFQYVAGYDIDERIRTTVDNLAEVFRATDVSALLKNLGKSTHNNDPVIHFYETFLAEYDPQLRKARGVWYTPEPVVKFIVRAVDDLLKSEFGLKDGLADISKTTIKVKAQGTAITKGRNKGKAVYVNKEVHRVQVLDPATGTGTFLAEVVKFIYNKKFKGMQGAWSGYVEDHLIPRLNGFELLMASYSMAHLKLDMLLTETGYKPKKDQRFNIYLTNSLEEHHPHTGTLFSTWLSSEANEANHIKRDTPVMVVLGNPPYSVSSNNKGEWIRELIKDYKKDLNEKKLNLDDDYIKFIRYAQHYIEKNGDGILAYISNNSFVDGVTHRQMRKNLLETFGKIYILNLHGNSNQKETRPDGGKDENVFDIMQGVSINIFIKLAKQKNKPSVYHFDSFGHREDKYSLLSEATIDSIPWNRLDPNNPYFFFTPQNACGVKKYETGFLITELFRCYNNGLKTDRDALFLDHDKNQLKTRIKELLSGDLSSPFKEKYRVIDSGSYKITNVIVGKKYENQYLADIAYRPFELRWIYYDPEIISRPAQKVMKHIKGKSNVSLALPRQVPASEVNGAWISNSLCGHKVFSAYNINTIFPLYVYPQDLPVKDFIGLNSTRKPNLNIEIVGRIAKKLGLIFTDEKEETEKTFAPLDLLDYIYAVLYCPTYQEKYKEFLKIDFPRIPYPKDKDIFSQLVKLGGELRQIHLLASTKAEEYITTYPEDGDNVITRKLNKNDWELYDIENQLGRIWLNDSQYFDQVPLIAWDFYIGGYQPAQKWLKDRRGRMLSFEDIKYYQKIIVALFETNRIMQEIDKIDFDAGT